MVELGIGQHRDLRVQLQQRAVGFVGLDHDPLSAAPPGIGAGQAQLAADDVRRIHATAAEDVDDHGRGRRLSVSSGHRHTSAQARDLGQQVGPMKLPLGDLPLGILRRDRGRVDDLRPGRNVACVMTDQRLDSVLAKPA